MTSFLCLPHAGAQSSEAPGPCSQPSLTVTLQWDDLGLDWELHLLRPGGHINDDGSDCTWTSCISESPDWGRPGETWDNPLKDADVTGAYGPESICLSGPELGTYTVWVEHWNSGGSPESDGTVSIRVGSETYVSEVSNLAPYHVWRAATIEWPSGAVELGTEVVDCSANWSGGCQLALE